MKKLIQIPVLIFVLIFISSCSSNNTSEDDLSIAEINEIEKTGEFSEEDFFSDEEVLAESGVSVDLEGVDSDLDIDEDAELLSDIDVDDFEGENFDESSDFETDFADSSSSEFDEFDEFVTDENVAANEEFSFDDSTMIADIEDPAMGSFEEEDVFAEFEQSTDGFGETADSAVPTDDGFDFESAFEEDAQVQEQMAADTGATTTDDFTADMFEDMGASDEVAEDSFDSFDDFGSGEVIANTGEVIDSSEPTASEVLGSKDYTGVGQEDGAAEVAKSWVPVQKMKTVPFTRSGILLNALYIVRPGDSFDSIKNKIYGSGSAANLAALNPTLRPNNLEVGEKIYYNSPNRPNDNSRMLFYYDDVGAAPQYHQISAGQNIRKVSEDLLGHHRSWMEVWATNSEVESKWSVNQSHNLKYFPEGLQVPALAQNQEPSFEQEVIEPIEEPQSVTANMNEEPDFNAGFETDATASESGNVAMEENQDPFAEDTGIVEPDFNQGFDDQANMGEPDFGQGFDDQANAGEPDFDQGFNDASLGEDPGFDQGFEDDMNAGTDTAMANPDAASQAIPENFKAKDTGPFGLDKQMMDTVMMGGGALLLLAGLLLVARKRRRKNEEASVEDFDFGGNTQIDEQTKTHIDI